MSDPLDDFGAPGGSLDDFLAAEMEDEEGSESTDEEQSLLPGGCTTPQEQFDPERELTLYGAMLVAAEAAVDALRGRTLSSQANAFRSYLISFRNELRS